MYSVYYKYSRVLMMRKVIRRDWRWRRGWLHTTEMTNNSSLSHLGSHLNSPTVRRRRQRTEVGGALPVRLRPPPIPDAGRNRTPVAKRGGFSESRTQLRMYVCNVY